MKTFLLKHKWPIIFMIVFLGIVLYFNSNQRINIQDETDGMSQKERYVLLNQFLDSVDKGADILIVQNGILFLSPLDQRNLRRFTSDQLSSILIMKWQDAKTLYGPSAKSINLIITTYNQNYNYKPQIK